MCESIARATRMCEHAAPGAVKRIAVLSARAFDPSDVSRRHAVATHLSEREDVTQPIPLVNQSAV